MPQPIDAILYRIRKANNLEEEINLLHQYGMYLYVQAKLTEVYNITIKDHERQIDQQHQGHYMIAQYDNNNPVDLADLKQYIYRIIIGL